MLIRLISRATLIVVWLASVTIADDIGLIKITSPDDLRVATATFGTALGRVGNDYLVQANANQLASLEAAGMEFRLLMDNADRSELALALSENPQGVRSIDMGRIGPNVEIDRFTQLLKISPTLARSVSESSEAMLIPLEDEAIPFHYDPPLYKNPALDTEDFPTDSIINRVSQDSIFALDQHLQDYNTRYIWTNQIDQARDWMINKFKGWGYANATSQQLYWGGGYHFNVMAVKEGYAEPDKVIVIGGHYDSINFDSDPYSYAPGADDDGSGTATTLELARILADLPTRKTIIFMPFTAEEVGLVGSAYAAQQFAANGTDIEVMFNFDMVGYDPGNEWLLQLGSGPNDIYMQIHQAAAARLTPLNTFVAALGNSSDHYSFHRQGFAIVDNIEGNFNYPGWHTDQDLTSNMNFPFFTDVVRAAAASIYQIAQSPSPQDIKLIADVGDGSGLEVDWSSCSNEYTYKIYYGTYEGARTDSITGLTGVCSYLLSGLTTGQRYYFQVFAESPEGYQSPYATSASEMPLIIPRAPTGLVVSPDLGAIDLNWSPNIELDFLSFNLYRKIGDGSWELFQSNLTDTSFVDVAVTAGQEHYYRLTALDASLNESDYSTTLSAMPATFDQGITIADETRQEQWATPDQAHQEAWFDTIFSNSVHGLALIDNSLDAMTRNESGPYSSIFWIDDDYSYKDGSLSEDTLRWYLGYSNNMLIEGWQSIWGWSDHPTLTIGEILFDEFMLSSYEVNITPDFIGAIGQNGWPTVTLDPSRGYLRLSMIPKLFYRPGAQVIYTFDSYSNRTDFEGYPAAIAYDGPKGRRVLLGFPLYYLTPESATNLITKAMEYFGEEIVVLPCCGKYTGGFTGNTDCDPEGKRNLVDVTQLIDAVYVSHAPLCCRENGNLADPELDQLNLADIVALIDHIYISKAETTPCQ